MQDMKILAHRGASGIAPENTLPAFTAAIEAGADGIEFDVQMTKDGVPVVIHDESVDRTTDGEGLIKDHTLEEIKRLNAGGSFSAKYTDVEIPTLEEVLDLAKGMNIINLELKNGIVRYEGLEEKVINLIKIKGLLNKTIFSSFNHYSLKKISEIEPEAQTGILYMAGIYRPWDYARKLGAFNIHPFYAAVRPDIVRGIHEVGGRINVFGTEEAEVIKNLASIGVDMVITDHPEKTRKIIS